MLSCQTVAYCTCNCNSLICRLQEEQGSLDPRLKEACLKWKDTLDKNRDIYAKSKVCSCGPIHAIIRVSFEISAGIRNLGP